MPGSRRFFRQAAGGPVFLLGKFLDAAAPSPLQFSHTLLSERLSDADRQAMLDRHVALGLNKMNVYLANRGDYGGALPTTPWLGTAEASDKRRFDLRRWRTYEEWIGRLRDAGLVAQLWFFADDSDFGALPEADRRRLLRYGMARLSADEDVDAGMGIGGGEIRATGKGRRCVSATPGARGSAGVGGRPAGALGRPLAG